MLRCLNTKGKYGKVTDKSNDRSIICEFVMIIIFAEFNQLIDYPINRASLNVFVEEIRKISTHLLLG